MNHYNITTNKDEITNNTTYDPSVLTTTGYRLQFNRGNVTFKASTDADPYGIVTIDNDLSTGTFAPANGTIKFKVDRRKGWTSSINATNSRITSSAAIGGTLHSGSFSFGGWFSPRDGQGSIQYLLSDVQNTASINQNRVGVTILADGKIQAFAARGGIAPETTASPGTGTRRLATTANVIFADALQKGPKHIAVVFNNGGFIQIYVNGILQTLDAVENGNISAVDLNNYVNATTTHVLFSRRTGASSFDLPFYGMYREVVCQKVAWSSTDVANIMSN